MMNVRTPRGRAHREVLGAQNLAVKRLEKFANRAFEGRVPGGIGGKHLCGVRGCWNPRSSVVRVAQVS